jgi:predicted nuclease of predicted toxin-antitoxin system
VTEGLLADENFPLPVVDGLAEAGYDVMSIAISSPGINDLGVLELACRTERRLLTFDSDFGDLLFSRKVPEPPAVLYFRIHPILPGNVLAAALRAIPEVPDGYFAVITREHTRLRPFATKATP